MAEMVRKSSVDEIINHWLLAGSCILLALTGFAFLAFVSALGLLTMKGLVEPLDEPLICSDEQLIEGLSRIFTAAAT